MSVIGLGKAYRDQTRAAEATRSRSDRGGRFEASDALPVVDGRAPCASCGVTFDRAELVFAEHGAVCLGCEADAELAAVAMPGPLDWLVEALLPAPALLCALVLSVPWWQGAQPRGKGFAFWAIASAVAVIFALMGGLTGARAVVSARNEALHPSSETRSTHRSLALALGGWGVFGNVAAALWLVALWGLIYG